MRSEIATRPVLAHLTTGPPPSRMSSRADVVGSASQALVEEVLVSMVGCVVVTMYIYSLLGFDLPWC